MQIDDVEPSVGRGRGRGGGGVPVLPAGMWDSLHGNSNSSNDSAAELESFLADSTSFGEAMPSGFGRGGRGPGRAGGRGGRMPDARGRGRGIERDLKGKDWECPSCTNVNWSWRSTCNKCNAAKPAAVIAAENEIRDGAGRGFNERQDRASAATVEIDEEGFDDFGRRVKKTRQVDENKKAKELAALNRMAEKYKHLLPTNNIQKPSEVEDQTSSGGRFDDAEESKRNIAEEVRENTSSDSMKNGKEKEKDAESKDKERDRKDRERDRDKDRGRDRDRDEGRGRDKDRDKDGKGREREKDGKDNKDRESDRNREDDKDRARERDKDRHRDRDRDRSDRDRDQDRDRDRHRDRDRDRDRDKDRDREKDGDRGGKRRRSSSR